MNQTVACDPPESPERLALLSHDEQNEVLARFAKALGHPARVSILRLLLRRESCVCGEIVDELPLAQSTVSQHLRVLKEAGLVQGSLDPPRVCYCVDRDAVRRLQDLLGDLADTEPPSVISERTDP